MTAIIILNWNGAEDTIECLQSLRNVPEDFFCVIVDNGSSDNSVIKIEQYMQDTGIIYRIIPNGVKLDRNPANHEIIIYTQRENLGFAKGNNEAIRLVLSASPENYLLLNNDTIVEPSFLQSLLEFSKEHPNIQALTPLICYHYDHNIVWNAGGRQFFGFRKYFYAKQHVHAIKEVGHIMVTFLTGCALFFKPNILRKDGGLFTEDFFFGEEDFNFCLQMNKRKRKMACVLSSKIYHKVSSSTKNSSQGRYYIHYLNRFIDIRKNYSFVVYIAWMIPCALYATLVLAKNGLGFNGIKVIFRVIRDANKKNIVTRQDFIKAINK